MTRTSRLRRWRWLRHLAWVIGINGALFILFCIVFFGSGAANPILRRLIVHRIEKATGGNVDLRTISIRWLSLRVTLKGLVVHGLEPSSVEPLFAAEEVNVGLRVDSFWGRKISLESLMIRQPLVHIRMEKSGRSNIPVPQQPLSPKKPLRETLFDLHIRRVEIQNGWLLYNDVRTPLAVEGGDLQLLLTAGGTGEHPLYLGNLDWRSFQYTLGSWWPIPSNLSAKFTFWRDGLTIEQAVLGANRSKIDFQAEMNGFVDPQWTFRYRGWVDLLDFREVMRQPSVPTGKVDVRGQGSYTGGKFSVQGNYVGTELSLPYDDFHASGIVSRASYKIDNKGLVLPDFNTSVLGGSVTGKITLRFSDLFFKAETHVQGVRLAGLFPDVEHKGFPIDELHWDAMLTADTVEIWNAAFHHFEIAVKMMWEPPATPAVGHEGVSGQWQFSYKFDPNLFYIDSGEFETPTTRGVVSGLLASKNTSMDLMFSTTVLERYNDFIHAIEGVEPNSADARKMVAGNVTWDGRIVGASGGPTFDGRIHGENLRYDKVSFDRLQGDLSYSPDALSFTGGRAVKGATQADVDLDLQLTKWSFLPSDTWSADVNLEKVQVGNLEELAGYSYPVRGLLTGQFHGRGTREEPALTGLFDLADGEAYGLAFNRLRGQLNVAPDEVRIADAELRFFAPGKESGRGAGIVTGSAAYRFDDQTVSAELVGASLPLESFHKLQSTRLPMGGQVTFRLKVKGPAKTPQGDGTFRVVDWRVGNEVIGSFDGTVTSDGKIAKLSVGSAMTAGQISGAATLGLGGAFPIDGKVMIKDINLDPFLLTALHLTDFNGHGKAEGDIAIHGNLKEPESLIVSADFSRLELTYSNVKLNNVGPVRFRSSKDILEVESVTLQGTDTNIQVGGSVRFSGRRMIALRLNGGIDLRLINGFMPDMSTGGTAQINASVDGTLDSPRITGRVHVENASARVAEFPTGLSGLTGDLVFDTNRLFFENVTGQAGGGTVFLAGSINYAETPLRYDVSLRTERVRIRYPEGMSWQAAGTLRLTGSTKAGVLSGRVTIERVTLNAGLETAGALLSAKEGISGPSTSSPFLRDLQFDIEAVSTPDARMEWPGAGLEADANLRVRGTWEHPIMLGHIHILAGELYFAGNRYRVSRGDVNFANPFRLDPVLNVEATTTIQQYEITLNFNGPSSKLTLAYRSDPPLPPNDIVTLLALGQTTSEASTRGAGATQTSSSGATALLSEAISSQLGGRLERLFGITRLRVDPGLAGVGSTGSSQNAAARVTVEQQITRNLTVTYVSNVSSTQEQVIQVEYNVNRNVSIVALRDQNGTFGIDVKIKKRFQ